MITTIVECLDKTLLFLAGMIVVLFYPVIFLPSFGITFLRKLTN